MFNNVLNLFLDQDGVMANWVKLVCHELAGFDCIDKFNKHENISDILTDIYTRYPDVYRRLEVIDPFYVFAQYIREVMENYPVKLHLLTAAHEYHPDYNRIVSDKTEWINEHNSKFKLNFNSIIVTRRSSDKYKYACPRSILVDDYDKNCIQFTNSGGHSLHMGELGLYDPHQKGNELIELVDKVMRNIR